MIRDMVRRGFKSTRARLVRRGWGGAGATPFVDLSSATMQLAHAFHATMELED